jgi:hypothetical protein
MKNWKTTAIGILILISVLCKATIAVMDNDPNTNPDISSIIGALAGLGLMAAKDNNNPPTKE